MGIDWEYLFKALLSEEISNTANTADFVEFIDKFASSMGSSEEIEIKKLAKEVLYEYYQAIANR